MKKRSPVLTILTLILPLLLAVASFAVSALIFGAGTADSCGTYELTIDGVRPVELIEFSIE